MPRSRQLKRLIAAAACACLVAGATQIPSSSADLSGQISANKNTEQTLKSQISAESAQIEQTSNGYDQAEQQLDIVNAHLDQSIDQLRHVQTKVLEASTKLKNLEARLSVASKALSANLRTEYERGSPNLVDVILNAQGFGNLLSDVDFMKRVQKQDSQIVTFTRDARTRVKKDAVRLGELEQRDRSLTDQIESQRTQAAKYAGALLQTKIDQEHEQSGKRARLASVESQTQTLEAKYQKELQAEEQKAEQQAQETPEQVNSDVGVAINTGGMVQAPPGAPEAVVQMIAAGNSIATLPYIWGGGHASFSSPGYDCSGSVSFVLAAAGLLSSPETSDEFTSYGDPGPGKWVTIYATDGHVWMTIAGWRFDTVALAEDGTRWAQGGGEYGGYVERHPPGL